MKEGRNDVKALAPNGCKERSQRYDRANQRRGASPAQKGGGESLKSEGERSGDLSASSTRRKSFSKRGSCKKVTKGACNPSEKEENEFENSRLELVTEVKKKIWNRREGKERLT